MELGQEKANQNKKEQVKLIWYTLLNVSEIDDFSKVPKLTNPEHNDVKVVLVIYSLQSFLYERINSGIREQDSSLISTLGPYAVALTSIINNIQAKRADRIEGPFTCYSGMALHQDLIQKWS